MKKWLKNFWRRVLCFFFGRHKYDFVVSRIREASPSEDIYRCFYCKKIRSVLDPAVHESRSLSRMLALAGINPSRNSRFGSTKEKYRKNWKFLLDKDKNRLKIIFKHNLSGVMVLNTITWSLVQDNNISDDVFVKERKEILEELEVRLWVDGRK